MYILLVLLIASRYAVYSPDSAAGVDTKQSGKNKKKTEKNVLRVGIDLVTRTVVRLQLAVAVSSLYFMFAFSRNIILPA